MENYSNKYKKIIEELAKKSPGMRANPDLYENIVEESLKKLEIFIKSSGQIVSIDIYLKKIVNSVVIETIKNAEKIRAENKKRKEEDIDFVEVPIQYRTNEDGGLLYNVDTTCPQSTAQTGLSNEQADKIKQKILEMDKEYPEKEYKRIFELRFLRELQYKDIAKKLDFTEKDTLNSLSRIFKEVNLILK